MLTRSDADIKNTEILVYPRYAAVIINTPDNLCYARYVLCIFMVQYVNTLPWDDVSYKKIFLFAPTTAAAADPLSTAGASEIAL